jgi:hypothetical protein
MRLGLCGEEGRLFGVGAKAAGDAYEEPRLVARGGRHAVEGERNVGPHRLAHARIFRADTDRGRKGGLMAKRAARKKDCEAWIQNLLMAASFMPPITIDALERGELDEQVRRVLALRGRSVFLSDPQQVRDAIRVLLEILDRLEDEQSS